MYNDFSTTVVGNIDPVPDVSNTGTEANNEYWRSKKAISNQDLMLDLNHPGENFNFERVVNSKGSYYISGSQVTTQFAQANLFSGTTDYYNPLTTPNIGNVIADLEQVATTATAYTTPNREGFNLLIVPANMIYIPVEILTATQPPARYLDVQAGFKTICHIKAEADWEGWDYNYGLVFPDRSLVDQHQRFNTLREKADGDYYKVLESNRKRQKTTLIGEDKNLLIIANTE
jgi:hypothetical protein